jgi:Domain of unknown function (DUF6930)
MVEDLPTNDQWRRLYEAAVLVKELSPWKWMTETDVFGVQDPETEEIGFVSVLGLLGEHFGVSLYPNPRALYDFWALEEAGPEINPDALLEIPQLQASFEDRDQLDNRDRKVIKELGFKFRGRKEWPMFRSYRPGFLPWFLEAEEARSLAEALDQLLEVAPRFREDRSLLVPEDESTYLVRVSHQEGGTRVWEDTVMEVPPPEPVSIQIEMNSEALESLESLPQSGHEFEMDLFMFPAPIQGEKGERPVFPYMLLAVDAGTGMVVSTDLLEPVPSLEAMWGSVPLAVTRQLAGLGIRPERLTVGSELLFGLLQPLAESSRFELERSPFLPALHEAREALFEAFGG